VQFYVIDQLTASGVKLRVKDGKLQSAPNLGSKPPLADELAAIIRANETELKAVLTERCPECDAALTEKRVNVEGLTYAECSRVVTHFGLLINNTGQEVMCETHPNAKYVRSTLRGIIARAKGFNQ
jgi:hypothetical protein